MSWLPTSSSRRSLILIGGILIVGLIIGLAVSTTLRPETEVASSTPTFVDPPMPSPAQSESTKTTIKVDGIVIEAAPGEVIDIERTGREDASKSALSAGLSTSSESATQNFKTGNTNLGGDIAGGSSYEGEVFGKKINIFYMIGAGLLVIAVIYFALTKDLVRTLYIAAGAGACIAVGVTIEEMPYIWILLVVVGIGYFVMWAWDQRQKKQATAKVEEDAEVMRVNEKALLRLISIVDRLPEDARKMVKDFIKTDPEVAQLISDIKRENAAL